MPTAILRYFTTDGFVIGADGKKCEPDTGKVLETNTQKLFEISGSPAAYAMYGEIGVGDDNPDTEILLDISVELKRIVASIPKPGDFLTYGREVGAQLQELLGKARSAGAIFHGNQESLEPVQVIARVFIFGYEDGVPSEVNIVLAHREQVLRYAVFPVDLRRSNPEVFGSLVIQQRLFPQPQSNEISPSKAAQEIERYIQACDCEDGRAADPFCNFIGGHVHIAAITPRGFQWLKPPIGIC